MGLACWIFGHDPFHPKADVTGRLVATCRRCDADVALDLRTAGDGVTAIVPPRRTLARDVTKTTIHNPRVVPFRRRERAR